jgi:hypothetical protein
MAALPRTQRFARSVGECTPHYQNISFSLLLLLSSLISRLFPKNFISILVGCMHTVYRSLAVLFGVSTESGPALSLFAAVACCSRFGVTGDDDNSLKDIQHKHNTHQAVHERALATNSANAKEVKYGVDPPFEIKSKPYSINLSLAPSVYNSIYSILQFAVLHNLSIPTNHIIY